MYACVKSIRMYVRQNSITMIEVGVYVCVLVSSLVTVTRCSCVQV
jgi:hypothetical protein